MAQAKGGSSLITRAAGRVRTLVSRELPADFSQRDKEIIRAVQSYTMTTYWRLHALINAVDFVVKHDIPGDIVECGVWKGGSMMAVAKTLLAHDKGDRTLWLYDTYGGMPAPIDKDIARDGRPAAEKFEKVAIDENSSEWCYASLDDVKKAVLSTGYDASRIHFIPGKVEDTIPEHIPERISLLRLDTDWYESTKHELVHMYDRLTPGGILILDDYGAWQGARAAVDEYIEDKNLRLFLHRIDESGRIAVKPVA
jgi:O-methyltransferase